MADQSMIETAKRGIQIAEQKGAREAGAVVSVDREVSVTFRDGKLEKISEATRRALVLRLYVDGRFSAVSTSDLRPDALGSFIENAVALTRVLAADPYRTLPDPALYKGQSDADLSLEDPRHASLTADDRRRVARDLEAAARSVKGADAILSVTTSFWDTRSESVRVHSNGFEGSQSETSYSMDATVSVKDTDGRRPEEYDTASARFFSDLPDAAEIGRSAAERALGRIGSKKIASGVMPLVLDHRISGRLFGYLQRAVSGSALQQQRSFLEGKLGQAIASAKLDLVDDPLLPKGLGSRRFDSEGIAAKRLPIVSAGVLKAYYIDTYYGKKLKMAPTTGGMSNLVWKLGDKPQSALVGGLKEAILVTRFLGGNSNDTTGDFSLGIQGFSVRGGQLAEPIAEMNVAGNHLEMWKRLVAVGNDPYAYSASRAPTLVFDGVQIAGT